MPHVPYNMIKVIHDAKKRRKKALGWRNKGMKVQEIADRLGCTKQRASAILQQARRD